MGEKRAYGGIENVRESRLDDSIKQIAEGLPLAVEGDLVLLHNAIYKIIANRGAYQEKEKQGSIWRPSHTIVTQSSIRSQQEGSRS